MAILIASLIIVVQLAMTILLGHIVTVRLIGSPRLKVFAEPIDSIATSEQENGKGENNGNCDHLKHGVSNLRLCRFSAWQRRCCRCVPHYTYYRLNPVPT